MSQISVEFDVFQRIQQFISGQPSVSWALPKGFPSLKRLRPKIDEAARYMRGTWIADAHMRYDQAIDGMTGGMYTSVHLIVAHFDHNPLMRKYLRGERHIIPDEVSDMYLRQAYAQWLTSSMQALFNAVQVDRNTPARYCLVAPKGTFPETLDVEKYISHARCPDHEVHLRIIHLLKLLLPVTNIPITFRYHPLQCVNPWIEFMYQVLSMVAEGPANYLDRIGLRERWRPWFIAMVETYLPLPWEIGMPFSAWLDEPNQHAVEEWLMYSVTRTSGTMRNWSTFAPTFTPEDAFELDVWRGDINSNINANRLRNASVRSAQDTRSVFDVFNQRF